jgi:hypothetical protein
MFMAFIVSVGILAVFLQNLGGPLAADLSRDRMLHVPIQDFFEGLITVERLNSAMDEYAREFETKPYKVGRIAIDLAKVPENQLRAWAQVVLPRLIGPTLQAFIHGTVTPTQAAVKIAPFVLVFGGPYGFDSATGPHLSQELTQKISEFAAP